MIDLHSHILPGIDDGSKDLEMTRKLLEMLSAQGVTAVAATPHFYAASDLPNAFLERRAAAVQQLEALKGEYPKVIPGAEVAYFDGMRRSGILEQLQLGSSGMLLVEMPFCPWTSRMIREICDLQLQTGLIPVLAHVNRYRRSDQLPRHMDQLLKNGILFQCNAEAFLSVFSRGWALRLLEAGGIHFLGSDAHNLTSRPPKLQQAAQIITKKLGEAALEELTEFTARMLKV